MPPFPMLDGEGTGEPERPERSKRHLSIQHVEWGRYGIDPVPTHWNQSHHGSGGGGKGGRRLMTMTITVNIHALAALAFTTLTP